MIFSFWSDLPQPPRCCPPHSPPLWQLLRDPPMLQAELIFTVVILLPTSAPSFLPSPELSMFSAETTMTLSASESSFSDGVNSSSSLPMLELLLLLLVYPFLSSGVYFSKCATSTVSYVSDYDSTYP